MGKPVLSEVGKSAKVGFNGRALSLNQRSEADIWSLAELAITAKDKLLLTYFKELPTQEEIEAYKAGNFVDKATAVLKKNNRKNDAPVSEELQIQPTVQAEEPTTQPDNQDEQLSPANTEQEQNQ